MASYCLSTCHLCGPPVKGFATMSVSCRRPRNSARNSKQTRVQSAAVDAHKLGVVKLSAVSKSSVERIQPSSGLDGNSEGIRKGYSYLFHTEIGGLVEVSVGVSDIKYVVKIKVSPLPLAFSEKNLVLGWGTFCSDSSSLYFPDSEAIKTPFTHNPLGGHTIKLEFDATQTPFYFSFLLHPSSDAAATDAVIRTHGKRHFCVPVGVGPGCPMPLGVSTSQNGLVNFSLFSRNAESVVLCLYDGESSQPSLEIELDSYINRTGDIWHLSMESVGNYVRYGYRCKGTSLWDKGSRFHARRVLLDPYAKLIGNFVPDQGESVSLVKCLGYIEKEPTFDWTGDILPKLPMEKMVVYRLNVGHFTKDKSSGLPSNIAGTFAGVTEKVQHFIDLGVNAVLLEPVFAFDEKKGPYFPYHFFSPMDLYGDRLDSTSAITSMKRMIKTLHTHGIEVLLEVVFTHTSEGGDADCQTISFRGIDNSSYYIVDGNVGSGINNAVKCNNPIVQQMILDSLRHWLTDFHVDGFCFINSSFLLRGPNGHHLSRPPLVEAIAFDPLLSKTKIIADCWSPVGTSYVDIKFPHWKRWAEMNARFCMDVRNFLRGKGLLSNLATRLCGSGDLFSDSRGPTFSFNYVTKNFGLPLVDLVSFSDDDELAAELSWNCGEEGPTKEIDVLDIRLRQIRNFLFVLFVSLGVPVINMGDECGFSTGGSSSYDDRHPINWNGVKTIFGMQIMQFITFLTSLRVRRSDIFQRKEFLKIENILWHGSNQSHPEWEEPACKFLAVRLRAEKDNKVSLPGAEKNDEVSVPRAEKDDKLPLPGTENNDEVSLPRAKKDDKLPLPRAEKDNKVCLPRAEKDDEVSLPMAEKDDKLPRPRAEKEEDDEVSLPNEGDLFVSFNASDCTESVILPQLREGDMWLRLVDTALPFPGFFSYNSDPNINKVEPLSAYELKPHCCALFEAEGSNS